MEWIQSLRESFPSDCWSDRAEELDDYSQDAWPMAIKLAQMGQRPFRPEVVFHARFPQQVPKLLVWAGGNRVPVTVWGAGSDVVGAALPAHGGILLDVSGLNKILTLDKTSLFVKVGAGLLGGALEAELAKYGFTLHHSPQSLERSTVGGWVAMRACGQFSSRWGGIEDLVLAVTVALANGDVVSTPLAPRAALGPDLKSVFIGSEGTLGVILDVTLRIFPVPEHCRLESLSFPSLQAGLTGMRMLMQSGLRPFLARLYDADESPHVARWSGSAFPSEGNLFLLGFEGLHHVVEAEASAGMDMLRLQGGTRLGPEISQGWMENRFDFSAVENRLNSPGGLAETIEVAHFWSGILDVYQALKNNLLPLAGEVLGHFSHAYPQGVSLYMILLGQVPDAAAAASRLAEIWDTAMRTSLDCGAAISHHHGIGLARQAYLREALGASYAVLERIKRALDPQGLLNPGKLAFRR